MRNTLAALLLLAAPSYASFLVEAASVSFDPASGMVAFVLQFNQLPDFNTVDAAGRPANSFQIMPLRVGGVPGTLEFYDSIVRGSEINIANTIVIRAPGPSRPDGSWGPTRIEVPFTLSGLNLTFAAPLSAIAPSHPDGRFQYELLALDYGAAHQDVRYWASSATGDAPEPRTMATVAGALLIALVYTQTRSRRRRDCPVWVGDRRTHRA